MSGCSGTAPTSSADGRQCKGGERTTEREGCIFRSLAQLDRPLIRERHQFATNINVLNWSNADTRFAQIQRT